MHRLLIVLMTMLFLSTNCVVGAEKTQMKTVLIAGGAGYIGSHVNKMLKQAGYNTIVLDNLEQGTVETIQNTTFIEGDISDTALLDTIFSTYHIDAVMHFAAHKNVGESMSNPIKYYANNVASTLILLDSMIRHNVKVFIFSSSAAIFGSPDCPIMTEDHPCHPINPYGQSKLMVETILKDLDRAYNLKFCCLRYFNAAGGDPDGLIKNYQKNELNLIPVVLKSIKNKTSISIFGTDLPTPDGTCIRDYIHIEDLGSAHILAMEKIFAGAGSNFYNLGNGKGFSVREVIASAERVTGMKVMAIESAPRPGDPLILLASPEKAKRELGWQPRYDALDTMILHSWQALQ